MARPGRKQDEKRGEGSKPQSRRDRTKNPKKKRRPARREDRRPACWGRKGRQEKRRAGWKARTQGIQNAESQGTSLAVFLREEGGSVRKRGVATKKRRESQREVSSEEGVCLEIKGEKQRMGRDGGKDKIHNPEKKKSGPRLPDRQGGGKTRETLLGEITVRQNEFDLRKKHSSSNRKNQESCVGVWEGKISSS